MLDFFRRHQRYFFIVITIVIVISFSFFGTYSTLSDSSFREQIAFTTVDGTEIPRHELDEMAAFIGTDSQDKQLFGGAWGPNFLNSGVMRKDFLENGLAAMLIAQYPDEIQKDLEKRLEKEKRFALYSHPQAPFISIASVWTNFAPYMKTHYDALRNASNPVDAEAINARIALFLGEREIPSHLMRQVMRYQEKQYSWLTPDPNLDYTDLSLFGYHTVEDWFGPRFVRLAAEFIMNTAVIAEQKGYEVSKADALADLVRNSEISFQQNMRSPHLGVANSQEYFKEQLRRQGMDANKAAKLWRNVLLFQRYFQDVGNSVFIDPLAFGKIDAFAFEGIEGQQFRLPNDLRLNNYRSLQKFEVYLNAVSKRAKSGKEMLTLPTKFLSVKDVSKTYPELVQKQYLLEVSSASKKTLQGKVGVKDSWNWEVDDGNWEQLKQQFPDLGIKNGDTRDERFAILDALDDKTRARIDASARAAIVEAHPEWLDAALAQAEPEKITIGLQEKVVKSPFDGLKDSKELMGLLDAVFLAGQDQAQLTQKAKEAADALSHFSADQNTYYRITVIERSPQAEIMTFGEADREGVLNKLLDSKLEAYYLKIREENPFELQRDDKSWKPLTEVRDIIADKYFEQVLKAIHDVYAAAISPEQAPQTMLGDFAAAWRLYPHVHNVEEMLKKNPASIDEWTYIPASSDASKGSVLSKETVLADQWKLERSPYKVTRSNADDLLDQGELYTLTENSWTKIQTPANGDIKFLHVERKINTANDNAIAQNIAEARQLLSSDVQQRLMNITLNEIKVKNAISLDYMDHVAELPDNDPEIAGE